MVEELIGASAGAMAAAVAERRVSPVELVEAHIRRIEALDGGINAVVVRDFEHAREAARAAERSVGTDGAGPLLGVPFTAKECIAVAGLPCTDGSLLHAGEVSTRDAVAVERVRAAGAILLGKTNISEFTSSYDSDNRVYGATRNPHDRSRSAGGSSGGEGAALAAGMTAFGLGSDYGGSIRVPGHFCGVAGLRPGRGVVPYRGHLPAVLSRTKALWSEIGPMARSVSDLELVLPILSGTRLPAPPPAAKLAVAAFDENGVAPAGSATRAAVRRAAEALAGAEHPVSAERPPGQEEADRLYDRCSGFEAKRDLSAAVAGRRAELSAQMLDYVEWLDRFEATAADYEAGLARCAQLEREVAAWMERRPLLLCPVACGPAFPLGALRITLEGGASVAQGDYCSFCGYANLLGLPAAVVPVARTAEGLPLGVQLIGRRGREHEVLAAARTLEQAGGSRTEPPARPG